MKHLQLIWQKWKKYGQLIGDFIARIILSLFYFTLFVPFALGLRLFGDPLGAKNNPDESLWLDREIDDITIETARRQF